jgi:hypothetical protein
MRSGDIVCVLTWPEPVSQAQPRKSTRSSFSFSFLLSKLALLHPHDVLAFSQRSKAATPKINEAAPLSLDGKLFSVEDSPYGTLLDLSERLCRLHMFRALCVNRLILLTACSNAIERE